MDKREGLLDKDYSYQEVDGISVTDSLPSLPAPPPLSHTQEGALEKSVCHRPTQGTQVVTVRGDLTLCAGPMAPCGALPSHLDSHLDSNTYWRLFKACYSA